MPGDLEPLIGFHLSLPIGYVESFPFFCILPETIADLANAWDGKPLQSHKLEELADTPPATNNKCSLDKEHFLEWELWLQHMSPLAREQLFHYVDVYINESVILWQGSQEDKLHVIRNLFHCIDQDSPSGVESSSTTRTTFEII